MEYADRHEKGSEPAQLRHEQDEIEPAQECRGSEQRVDDKAPGFQPSPAGVLLYLRVLGDGDAAKGDQFADFLNGACSRNFLVEDGNDARPSAAGGLGNGFPAHPLTSGFRSSSRREALDERRQAVAAELGARRLVVAHVVELDHVTLAQEALVAVPGVRGVGKRQ
jgi:hypothetical protein